MRRKDNRFRIIIFGTLLAMGVAGAIHHYVTREPTPEPEPVVVDTISEETSVERLPIEEVEKKIKEEQQARFRDRLKEIGKESFKDGARETKKSFLERFINGDLDDEEQE